MRWWLLFMLPVLTVVVCSSSFASARPPESDSVPAIGSHDCTNHKSRTQGDKGNPQGPCWKWHYKISTRPSRLQKLVDLCNPRQERNIFLSQLDCFYWQHYSCLLYNIRLHRLELSCHGADKVVGRQIVGGTFRNGTNGGKRNGVGAATTGQARLQRTFVDGTQPRSRVHPRLRHQSTQTGGMTAGFRHDGEQKVGLRTVAVVVVVRVVEEMVQGRGALTARQ